MSLHNKPWKIIKKRSNSPSVYPQQSFWKMLKNPLNAQKFFKNAQKSFKKAHEPPQQSLKNH